MKPVPKNKERGYLHWWNELRIDLPHVVITWGLAISSQVAISGHLSLRALANCRCDLGSGHFNLTGNGQTRSLLVSGVWPLHHTGSFWPVNEANFTHCKFLSGGAHTLYRHHECGPLQACLVLSRFVHWIFVVSYLEFNPNFSRRFISSL